MECIAYMSEIQALRPQESKPRPRTFKAKSEAEYLLDQGPSVNVSAE